MNSLINDCVDICEVYIKLLVYKLSTGRNLVRVCSCLATRMRERDGSYIPHTARIVYPVLEDINAL
jgi:hypothetical protein